MYRGRSVMTLASRTALGRSSRTNSSTWVIDTVLMAASMAANSPPKTDERDRAEQRGYAGHGSSKNRVLSSSRLSFSDWRSWWYAST